MTNFAGEISDIFIQCFSSLSVQTSIVASLLSLLFKSNRVFPAIVVEKLSAKFLVCVSKDEVQTAKLLLRAMASLVASNCVLLSGPNSILDLLDSLNSVTESSWIRSTEDSVEKPVLDHQGQVTAYLIATAIPWLATAFTADTVNAAEANEILLRLGKSCERVCAEWQSPFEVDGQQSVFHVAIVHATDSSIDPDSMAGESRNSYFILFHLLVKSYYHICFGVSFLYNCSSLTVLIFYVFSYDAKT